MRVPRQATHAAGGGRRPCRRRQAGALAALAAALCMLTAVTPAAAQLCLRAPRYAHSLTPLPDGRVLVYGGLGLGDRFARGTEILGADAAGFVPGPPAHRRRAFHTASLLRNGSVLIAGGFIAPYSSSRTAELFDGRRFVFLGSRMSAPRELHAATVLGDGRVLITGGFVGGVTSLAACDVFDPAPLRFTRTGDMRCSRFGHAATRLADGRVLVTGGSQFPTARTLADAELYDPATGRFGPAPPLRIDRSRHTANLLPDGRVFITGGNSLTAGTQLASTELYDPARGEFIAGPPMCEPRMDHTATLLADGRVLITGGFNGMGTLHTVASCEVFDPRDATLRPAGRLPAAVHEHQAALTQAGAVLATGGLRIEGTRRGVTRGAVLIAPPAKT